MVYNPDEIEKDYDIYSGGCWNCGTHINLKDGKEYSLFERGEFNKCKYFNPAKVFKKQCTKCKTKYSRDVNKCINKCLWKKGKNIGQLAKLKECVTNCEVCQLYRMQFEKV